MQFRYFLDTAYVAQHLRKSTIVALVLLVHGGLIWTLINFITPAPPPIELVETQVILEQPTTTPIARSPQVPQRVVDAPMVQPNPRLKLNEDAVIKEVVKPSALPTAATPAPTGKCSQAAALRITSGLVERNMTVRLVVSRNANSVTSVHLQNSTGNSSLDALIEQRARGLQFLNKGVECDGLSFTVAVALVE